MQRKRKTEKKQVETEKEIDSGTKKEIKTEKNTYIRKERQADREGRNIETS